jgi:2-dehydro-3-deoxyglucarate aldolase/4-hydroxy-2-oxoheptanedioate aldolase
MLWLGHNDLSVALGEPGAFDHPDFVQAEQATIAAARKHGKSAGRLAVDARQGARFAAMGYDFVSISGDVWLLQGAFAAGVATVRNGT